MKHFKYLFSFSKRCSAKIPTKTIFLTGDAAPPPLKPDVYRIYGMKHCPFVQRSKLVMHAANFKLVKQAVAARVVH